MILNIKKIHPDAKIPERSNNTDAGLDCFSVVALVIPVGQTVKVDTGISLELVPNSDDFNNYAIFVMERSSLGSKGIARRAGVVDFGYRGPLVICLTNHSDKPYQILKGDKIAQLVVQRVEMPRIEEVEQLSTTSRNSNGFGSTGR